MCNANCFFRQNRPKRGGICVANHTSPIDVVILANDGCYAMVSETEITLQCSASQILVFALSYRFVKLVRTFIFSFICMLCSALQLFYLIRFGLKFQSVFHIKQSNNFRTLGMAYINHIDYLMVHYVLFGIKVTVTVYIRQLLIFVFNG